MATLEYLTPEEVARELGQPLATVLGWIESDHLVAIHTRSGRRVPRPILERFLNPNSGQIPEALKLVGDGTALLKQYEDYFGVSANELWVLAETGATPDLADVVDERMWMAWLNVAKLLRSNNMLPRQPETTAEVAGG